MADNIELFDAHGRVIRSVVFNTAKDGSGTYYFPLLDSDGHLQADVLSGAIGHDITGIGHGVKTVSTAGTHEALAASTTAKLVIIQAQTDNTGLIAVGATGVDATEATGNGIILYAGDSVPIPCDNLADIYIDATVSGEGVRYSYLT